MGLMRKMIWECGEQKKHKEGERQRCTQKTIDKSGEEENVLVLQNKGGEKEGTP